MIKEEVNKSEQTIYRKFCDDCGNEEYYINNCEICGKDICNVCICHEEYSGDYRIVYCSECWNAGEIYRKKIEFLEKKIDKLVIEWHEKCNNIT